MVLIGALIPETAVVLAATYGLLGVVEDVLTADPLVAADRAISDPLQSLRSKPVDVVVVAVTMLGDGSSQSARLDPRPAARGRTPERLGPAPPRGWHGARRIAREMARRQAPSARICGRSWCSRRLPVRAAGSCRDAHGRLSPSALRQDHHRVGSERVRSGFNRPGAAGGRVRAATPKGSRTPPSRPRTTRR